MFRKILVANRGEIAIRAFRAAFELGARTVAVYPYEDRYSLHRLKADEAYQIGERGHPVRAYLDVDEIIRVARESGADAIYSHVGIVVTRDGAPAVVDVSPFGSGYVEYSDVSTFTTDPTTTNLLVVRPRVAFNAQRLDDDAARLAAAGVPFDYAFDMEDESALYCAELAFNLLRDAGVDLRSVRWTQMYVPFAGDRNLVTPDALARADTLQPVYRRKAS